MFPYHLTENSYWIFGVRCRERDRLILYLKGKGIATGVHYMPLPMHPLFRKYTSKVPVAERVWETVITLPLFPDLTDGEVDYVVESLQQFDRVDSRQNAAVVK